MIQQCHAAGVFGVLVFFSSKCTREILLCRKPEVILDLVFALQDCGAYFVSFSLSLFFFPPQQEGLVMSMRGVKLDVSDVNGLWFRLKELRLLN